ncbi:FtsK/SpoIIIE domain-containing protein [Promicromonospora thailandica]|uniref:DNA segregation ATPase FtsK/SpoIIIE, S-DNA-T family n=1 Tax=Promicromonospora thailandica TaxID=765201 RepID=A0A9X2G405_9MICO|nr:FtsK/SpoIIIE domain-containing protein [Promicromonospora thailandica]MCP2266399.1 DNA segregation ATPase FtsK/SpoIIIE, S-DNA-T family [Promicromonospora thailandica]BFF20078.1 FtsK/SpoIIIE domain-containing protein [Promicromonospora thailandica]
MTTPNEHMPGTPDDGLPNDDELTAMVYGSTEVEAYGLDQGAALVQPDGTDDEDNALSGEVIDPEPAREPEAAPRAPQVIQHRPTADRRQVLPDWLRSREAFVASARWAVGYGSHVCAYHAVRLPLYALRLAGRAPIGAGRITAAVWRWAADTENTEVRRALLASTKSDPNAFLRVRKETRGQAQRRGALAVFGLAGASGVAAGVATMADPVWQAATAAVALGVLGVVGRKRDAKITGEAMASAKVPPLTADLIRDALLSLGLGSMGAVKNDRDAVRFLAIARDGAGFRADIDLPPGATASEVMDKRSKLASGLRRPIGCVWPEGDPEVHEGRLVLYVGDRSLAQSGAASWPLAKKGGANIFEPIPLGVDQRGRRVDVTLMYASGIIGAVPRMGKTFTLRLLLLAAALDPRVEIHAYDFKGGADLDPLAKIAHAYRSGDDPEDMAALLADLRALVKEFRRRSKVLRSLPRDVVPEGKVTDELASRKDLGLHPIFVAFDETQIMFEHDQYGAEARSIVEDLVRRGPAVGIMVWLATQRPDAKSIPTSISANATKRLCLRVMGQVENDMVLGTSMYKNGIRATMFGSRDLGIAYLAGEGDDPVIVRTSYVDGPAADTITDRAHAVRKAQGRLTGLAAGDVEADTDTGTVLDHLLAVWPAEDPAWPNGKVWSDDLAARLGEHLPSLYEGWTGAQVNAAVKPHGIRTVQVKHDGTNKRGLSRADVVTELGDAADLPDFTALTDQKED